MFIVPAFIGVPLFFLIGSVLGSFGNVLVERLPAGESLGGRSHCMSCGKTLCAWELVPIVSWCCFGGKCIRCHSPIPAMYTVVELISGLLFVIALIFASFDPIMALPISVALWAMLCIALTDIRTQSIPDVLTLIIAICGVILRLHDQTLPIVPILIGGGFFGVQWMISRGKWVGTGDILLGAALGMFLGTWPLTVLMLWFAYVLGLLFVVVRLPFRTLHLNAHIAFGPFLVIGSMLTLLFGERIMVMLF